MVLAVVFKFRVGDTFQLIYSITGNVDRYDECKFPTDDEGEDAATGTSTR